jgi:hypothetical protein
MQVDLKDKWRNMCKARPELERVGRRYGDQPGPHGTPAALRRPHAEQVDEHPPRDAGAQQRHKYDTWPLCLAQAALS